MPRTPQKLLADAIAAGEAILAFTAGKTRQHYGLDMLLRSAVERQFEILGEAIRRLEVLDSRLALKISEHRRIIAFRNLIAHGYDSLDDDVVWQTITEKVPVLLNDARVLLDECDRQGGTK
ncbi:MAG: DUF86 domain-containing protein [Hyphomicrobiaceae bacterium]|nr:MAG: DUF86 domain-containing protein [Hyphomicrobiaceae bacterium]